MNEAILDKEDVHEHMSMHMKERWSSKRKENENAQ